jgi:hypothetical protein
MPEFPAKLGLPVQIGRFAIVFGWLTANAAQIGNKYDNLGPRRD